MKPRDALRVHLALAHTLLDVWPVSPIAQEVVHTELAGWRRRGEDDIDKYLALVSGNLRSGGVEERVIEALDRIPDEVSRIDGYLDQMFDTVVELVRSCYEKWADWSVPEPILETAIVVNSIYPDRANFGELGVVACVPPRDASDPVVVKLTFVPSLLGPPSWATVPYLLCHELICHVNQAAPMDSSDPFAEGWMDLVARKLHDKWADQIFPWAPKLARKAARRLSDSVLDRWQNLPEPHMTTRALRSQGQEAAEWVEEKLLPFQRGRQVIPPLVRLSLQLNRSPASVGDRMAFVSRVNDGSAGNQALQAKLLAELRRWNDLGDRADQVLSFG